MKNNNSNFSLPFNSETQIILSNISIQYQDDELKKSILIKELNIKQNKQTKIEINAVYEEVPIRLNLNTVLLENILNLQTIPINIYGSIGNIDLTLKSEIPIKEFDKKELKFIFNINLDDFSTVRKLTAVQLNEVGNINFEGELLKYHNKTKLRIKQFSVGETKFNGSIEYIINAKRPKIISKLNIQQLDLINLEKLISDDKKIKNTNNSKDELFSSKLLPFEYLDKYDTDIELNIKDIKHKLLELDEIKLHANLDDGLLNINKLFIKNTRSEIIDGKIRINARQKSPEINIILVTENIKLEKNNTLKEYLSGADTNIKIDLKAKGKSLQEIMENLNGTLIMKVGEGKLSDELLKFLSSNILTDLVSAINPIADKSSTTNLECAAIRFDIKDGVLTADKGIVMQTDKIQIISSGVIDLHTETLEFGIKPQARDGVELNLNSLASMVKLSGKIKDPEISMSLKDSAVVYSYFATGGMSFLAKSLYDTVSRDESPCETAILGPAKVH